MENQSTNDSSAVNKIVCRKCGGPHFTIKCGKEKKEETPEVNQVETKPEQKTESKFKSDNDSQTQSHKSKYNNSNNNTSENYKSNENFKPRGERKQYFKTTYRVKISELPTDMTEEEMMELTAEWGHIVRIRVLNYQDSSTAYVDFGYEAEADYFVKAIDKTPFEFLIISAIRVESTRPEKEKSDE